MMMMMMMMMMMIDDETHQKVSPLPGPLSIPFLFIRTFPRLFATFQAEGTKPEELEDEEDFCCGW